MIEPLEVFAGPGDELPHRVGEALVMHCYGEPFAKRAGRPWIHQAELHENAANAVAQRGALFLPPLAHAMARKTRLLFDGLHRHEPHPRIGQSAQDRLGIVTVVFHGAALAVRLDQFGRHDPGLQAEKCHLSGPVMAGTARFHADHAAARQSAQPPGKAIATQLASLDDAALAIGRTHGKRALCQIGRSGRNIHSRLPPRFRLILRNSILAPRCRAVHPLRVREVSLYSLERSGIHRGRPVLAMNCVLARAQRQSWSAAQLNR